VSGIGSREVLVARVARAGEPRDDLDQVVIEAPLEFRVDGRPGAVTMRTPGHDEELVRGFLFSEGVIGAASDIRAMRRPPAAAPADEGNVLDVELVSSLARRRIPERSGYASASCGVCGKVSLASIEVRAPRIDAPLVVSREVVSALPDRLRSAQSLFASTGGLHAAGAFDAAGDLLCVREDVGRHNAVDKLVGWAVEHGRAPLSREVLCVSGRLGFEIVQKAIAAGFPIVAAVSAPSSLAVELALRFGVTLCGFVRDGRFNVYANRDRIR
jgi:FdhD protein